MWGPARRKLPTAYCLLPTRPSPGQVARPAVALAGRPAAVAFFGRAGGRRQVILFDPGPGGAGAGRGARPRRRAGGQVGALEPRSADAVADLPLVCDDERALWRAGGQALEHGVGGFAGRGEEDAHPPAPEGPGGGDPRIRAVG